MIIINGYFGGGSTAEEHDIAHIASSILARLVRAFLSLTVHLNLANSAPSSSLILIKLNLMLFQHCPELMIGDDQQVSGAALVETCLSQRFLNQHFSC